MEHTQRGEILPQITSAVDSGSSNFEQDVSKVLELTVRELISIPNLDTHLAHREVDMQLKQDNDTATLHVVLGDTFTMKTVAHSKRTARCRQKGSDILRLRDAGKTQMETARILGISQASVSRVEREMRTLNA